MELSDKLKKIIEKSEEKTRQYHHNQLTIEHLITSVIENDEDSQKMLSYSEVDYEQVIRELTNHLENAYHLCAIGELPEEIQESAELTSFMSRAFYIAQAKSLTSETGIEPICLFYAVFDVRQDTKAKEVLRENGLSRFKLRQYVHNYYQVPKDKTENGMSAPTEGEADEPMLRDFTVDLTEMAEKGQLDPLIGRDLEVARVVHILSRRRKNNPILVGESGVGKTAIAEGLAQAIANKEVAEDLHNVKVLSLEINALLAGTKYRGDFEKRLKTVLDKATQQNIILFIDEAHTIMGAGNSAGGSLDMSNTLKPYLASGKVTCMAATTTEEYRQIFEQNAALSRRFNKVTVPPLTEEQTYDVISGLKGKFESHHSVSYTDEAIFEAIRLSERYIHNKSLPDKAVDIVDEAGALVKLEKGRDDKNVYISDIEQIISEITKKPVKSSQSQEALEKLKNLKSELGEFIFGQEEAIEKLVDSIHLAKAGIKNPEQPIGSFLFLGPTGVGKTEIAKQLSRSLDMNFIRMDMSEYMEKHTASKMVGAPPGYVGYEKGGELTEAVHDNPYSIILLDEMEKAHPDVFNLFLQVLDYGFLTDSNGRKIDFKNSLIIMTSNCGVIRDNQNKNGIGFLQEKDKRSQLDYNIINQTFSPEFQNRIDNIIEFNNLDKGMMENIVSKGLIDLQHYMDERHVALNVSQEVIDYLAVNGYDPDMGARPVNKLIKQELAKPISKIILFENVGEGSEIFADIKDGKIDLNVQNNQTKKKEKQIEKQKE